MWSTEYTSDTTKNPLFIDFLNADAEEKLTVGGK